jgi:hypothetical protein
LEGGKLFQVKGVAKWAQGVEIPFYSPWRECTRCGVREPDMSGKPLWDSV